METKTCTDCKEQKPLAEFHLRSDTEAPYARCKQCHAAYVLAAYHKAEAIFKAKYGMSRYLYAKREIQ